MDIKTIFKTASSDWVRYSEYEFAKAKDGEQYITPKSDAAASIYNPLDVTDTLLVDALNIGKLLYDKAPDIKKVEHLLIVFAKKYGLLGFMPAMPLNSSFFEQGDVYLGKYADMGKKTMPTKEYMDMFLPFDVKQNQPGNVSMFPLALVTGKSLVYEVVFSRNYSEKLEWQLRFFKGLFTHFGACFYYDKIDNPVMKSAYSEEISDFKNYGLGYNIRMLDKPTIVWDFNSLKTALETVYGFTVTSDDNPLKICKHCGTVFYAQNRKSEFDKPQCRNQYNVYKNRKSTKPKISK